MFVSEYYDIFAAEVKKIKKCISDYLSYLLNMILLNKVLLIQGVNLKSFGSIKGEQSDVVINARPSTPLGPATVIIKS